ncbi:MAG: hypothetical protein MUF49_15815 [Oculatellaceae cyanobacterium Prado106]|jgi:hypothetical protein|nr:hypothetical protein [Oculatellaceae cyanobacterium Prado106]
MDHPFNLKLTELETLDLEFEEALSIDEADQVNGSTRYITSFNKEQGDCKPLPHPRPRPRCPSPPIYPDLPIATTLALGEEGGWCPPPYTTMALGEEGGDYSIM